MINKIGNKLNVSNQHLKKLLSIRLLTVSEAAKMIKISEKKLIRFCQAGKISYFLIGKQYRFSIEDISRFL